jgi:DNA-binding PadR family transcriptional regulator
MHGYRIEAHVERNFDNTFSIDYGQIYPSLKRITGQRIENE